MARWNTTGVNAFPEYGDAAGGVSYPVYPTINEAPTQVSPNTQLHWGDQIVDKFGNTYVYVRAVAALSKGVVVRLAIEGEGDIPAAGTVSASTTKYKIWTNIDTTTTAQYENNLGSWLASPGTITGGAGTHFLKLIKGQTTPGTNTKFDISKLTTMSGMGVYDGDQLSAVPTTGDPVVVIRPYNVITGGAANASSKEGHPVGIALNDTTALYSTLVQTGGVCMAMALGSGTALVYGGPVSMAASGNVIGGSAVAVGVVGTALVASAATVAGLHPIRVQLVGMM